MADLSPLRRRMIEDMTVRNLSPATQRSYISAVSKFMLSHCATTTVRCSKKPIAISGQARLISTLPRCAHLVALPHAPSQQIGPSDLEQSP